MEDCELMSKIHEILSNGEKEIENLLGKPIRLYFHERLNGKTISVNMIIEIIEDIFELEKGSIASKSKIRPIPDARAMGAKIILDYYPRISQARVGKYFGGRDHSTISNRIDIFQEHYETEESFRNKYKEIISVIDKYNFSEVNKINLNHGLNELQDDTDK